MCRVQKYRMIMTISFIVVTITATYWQRLESSDLLMHGNLTDTSSYKECFCQLIII